MIVDDEDNIEGKDRKNKADGGGLTDLFGSAKRVTLCKKLEDLIHIELADLVANTPYLNDDFPSSSKLGTPKKSERLTRGSLSANRQVPQECNDCGYTLFILSRKTLIMLKLIYKTGGKRHKEEFSLKRPTKGPYEGKEWQKLVRPIIERWGKFVEVAY